MASDNRLAPGPSPEGPLCGLMVIELASVVAGPSVGAFLSDLGADVIKIEHPETGDSLRTMGQYIDDQTAWWLHLGRNKRTVTLDLKRPRGRDALMRMLAAADALVESFRPGVLERLDLAPDKMLEANSRLVIARISAYGQTGPYSDRPGFGTLAEAFSGLAAITGQPDGPPILPPVALADWVAGLFATWAVLAALYHRDVHDGPGQVIDVSLFESVHALLGPLPTLFRHSGSVPARRGSRLSFSSPRNAYRTRDGAYFAVSGTAARAAETIVALVGGPNLLSDPRFATPDARATHADELDEIVAAWISDRTLHQVEQDFERVGAAGVRVATIADLACDPHYQARKTLTDVEMDSGGVVSLPSPVPRFSRTPARIRHAGRERGSDTESVLGTLGYSEHEIKQGHAEGAW